MAELALEEVLEPVLVDQVSSIPALVLILVAQSLLGISIAAWLEQL